MLPDVSRSLRCSGGNQNPLQFNFVAVHQIANSSTRNDQRQLEQHAMAWRVATIRGRLWKKKLILEDADYMELWSGTPHDRGLFAAQCCSIHAWLSQKISFVVHSISFLNRAAVQQYQPAR